MLHGHLGNLLLRGVRGRPGAAEVFQQGLHLGEVLRRAPALKESHGTVIEEALIPSGQSLPGAEVVEVELQGVLILPAGGQLVLGLLPLLAAVVQLLLDALHGFRRGTGGLREGHGAEAALPQQVGHVLLGGLVADQQHVALLPVLADLDELRRELLDLSVICGRI